MLWRSIFIGLNQPLVCFEHKITPQLAYVGVVEELRPAFQIDFIAAQMEDIRGIG